MTKCVVGANNIIFCTTSGILSRGVTPPESICNGNKIKLIPYLHATKSEIIKEKYYPAGEKWIEIFKANGLEYVDGISFELLSFYRDEIHLNSEGHEKMAEVLLPVILEAIKDN